MRQGSAGFAARHARILRVTLNRTRVGRLPWAGCRVPSAGCRLPLLNRAEGDVLARWHLAPDTVPWTHGPSSDDDGQDAALTHYRPVLGAAEHFAKQSRFETVDLSAR